MHQNTWIKTIIIMLLGQGAMAQTKLYVGTFSERGSQGIYVYDFNGATGETKLLQTEASRESPSFLALHPTQPYLYSVNRASVVPGQKWGSVSAYAIDVTGQLTLINEASTQGAGACHLTLDHTGKALFAVNYSQGNMVTLPVRADGGVDAFSYIFQNEGQGPNQPRQNGPHMHQAVMAPNNKFCFVPDLGTDEILAFKFNAKKGQVLFKEKSGGRVSAGTGPRHMAFHPNGKWVYVASELGSLVTAFKYKKSSGRFLKINEWSTLPIDYTENNSVADIHIHPNGRYLYVSNRGHNSIVTFQIDPKTGTLRQVGHQSTLGDWPRNFNLTPDGKWMLVANRRTDHISFFRINSADGGLEETGMSLKIPAPVCILFKS